MKKILIIIVFFLMWSWFFGIIFIDFFNVDPWTGKKLTVEEILIEHSKTFGYEDKKIIYVIKKTVKWILNEHSIELLMFCSLLITHSMITPCVIFFFNLVKNSFEYYNDYKEEIENLKQIKEEQIQELEKQVDQEPINNLKIQKKRRFWEIWR